MKVKVLWLFLMLFSAHAFGQQNFLILKSDGATKRYTYRLGDEITLIPVRNFPSKSGVITAITEKAIHLNRVDSILYEDLAAIQVRKDRNLFPKNLWLINLVSVGGSMIIWEGMFWVNQGSFSSESKYYPALLAILTGVPLVSNLIARPFIRKYCVLEDGSWKLLPVVLPAGPK